MAKIMVVEDDVITREMIKTFLEYEKYEVETAEDGKECIEKYKKVKPDLILMDLQMPKINGIEATRMIKKEDPQSIIIILTAFDDIQLIKEIAEAGADDFLQKPVNFTILKPRIEIALKAVKFYHFRNLYLKTWITKIKTSEEIIMELNKKNENLIFETLDILSKFIEYKDYPTFKHTENVSEISYQMAKNLNLDDKFCIQLKFASSLHDIGKIGIPDNILLKPGKLNDEEWEIIKKHPEIGFEILKNSTSEILKMAGEVSLTHHERYDGSGYPKGLKGEEIPITGRIVAISDSFEAMISKRTYRDALSFNFAFDEIIRTSGKLYCPLCIKSFISLREFWEEKYKNLFNFK